MKFDPEDPPWLKPGERIRDDDTIWIDRGYIAACRIAKEEKTKMDTERAALEIKVGQVWNTEELQADFTVEGFQAPFVVVTRTRDGKRGSLQFQHHPRFYWGFKAE